MADLVIDTEVIRREEGLLLTLFYQSGRVEEHYLSKAEARDIQRQLEEQLSATS